MQRRARGSRGKGKDRRVIKACQGDQSRLYQQPVLQGPRMLAKWLKILKKTLDICAIREYNLATAKRYVEQE